MYSEYLPYGRQTVTPDDIAAVESVLRSPLLTQGPVVPAFEAAIANQVSVQHAIAVNSATSGLHLACLALGLEPGDTLWTSPTTFVASANCARYCGANVDFVDIDPLTGLMCPVALKVKLELAYTLGTLPKIIIPVHLCGTSCSMKQINYLAKLYDISIIEDASHAIGAHYLGNPVGCCTYSDAAVFSFHPVKIITSGEGGVVVTSRSDIAEKLFLLRSHGITKEVSHFQYEVAGPWAYEQQLLGFNYRLTDIQAALGLSQLNRLCSIVQERNILYQHYHHLLASLPVRLLEIPSECYSSVHLAVISLLEFNPVQHLSVFEGLRSCSIGVQLHYSPVHLQPYYRRLGFKEGDFPYAEAYAQSSLSLPLYPGLEYSDLIRVVHSLEKLLSLS